MVIPVAGICISTKELTLNYVMCSL